MAYAIQHRPSGAYLVKAPLGRHFAYLPSPEEAMTFKTQNEADEYRLCTFGPSRDYATVRIGDEPTIVAAG